MMRRLVPGVTVLGLLAWTLGGAPVRAADMAVPASPGYYPPTQAYTPALYNWSGVYIGIHGGGGLLSDGINQNGVSATATNLTSNISSSTVGLIGGAQVGLNVQMASWVIGAEGSWSATNISATGTSLTTIPNTIRMTSAPLWFGAVTGRVGYAFNTLLPYVKAGVGFMDVNYTQDTVIAGGVTAASQRLSDDRTGFTVGFGVEYGLIENVAAKFEYDFYDFGSRAYNFTTTPVSIRSDLHVFEAGLSYRFNWVR